LCLVNDTSIFRHYIPAYAFPPSNVVSCRNVTINGLECKTTL